MDLFQICLLFISQNIECDSSNWTRYALTRQVHCSDSRHLKTAEMICEYAKKHGLMSVCTYSALMKVYACAGMPGKACDLFDEMQELGME